MAGQVTRSKRLDAEPKTEENPKSLAHRLVKQLANRLPEPGLIGPGHEDSGVMLDLMIEGVRCLVVRAPPLSAQLRSVLSPREREIARMVAKGHPNKTIAGVLEISTWTVGTYLRRIFAKLGVGSRAAMVAKLAANGQVNDFMERQR
jgi:DNA-binding CsgD family transcriptional regulator